MIVSYLLPQQQRDIGLVGKKQIDVDFQFHFSSRGYRYNLIYSDIKPRLFSICTVLCMRRLLFTNLLFFSTFNSSSVISASENTACWSLGESRPKCEEAFSIFKEFEVQSTLDAVGCVLICRQNVHTKKRNPIIWANETAGHYGFYRGMQHFFLAYVSWHEELSQPQYLVFMARDDSTPKGATLSKLFQHSFVYLAHAFNTEKTKLFDDSSASSGKQQLQLYPLIFQPDYHFIGDRGFINLFNAAASFRTPFERRIASVFWRGAPHHTARMGVCLASRNCSWMDAKISIDKDGLEALNITGNRAEEETWFNYRGVFDIDGFSNAWGLIWRLASGSVVFKVDSPIINAYISKLQPWIHYVPISTDLHDLRQHTRLVLGPDNTIDSVSISSPASSVVAAAASSEVVGDGITTTSMMISAAEEEEGKKDDILKKQIETLRILKNITVNARRLAEEFTYEKEVRRVAYEISNYFQIFKHEDYDFNHLLSSGSSAAANAGAGTQLNSSNIGSSSSAAGTQLNSYNNTASSSRNTSSSNDSDVKRGPRVMSHNNINHTTSSYNNANNTSNYNYARLYKLWGHTLV